MRRCTGNNTQEWGFDAIFDIKCDQCGHLVEFFKDEISRKCPGCNKMVRNNKRNYDCRQQCSSLSTHRINFCPKFKRSKERYYKHFI